MMDLYRLARPLLFALPPECAHRLAVRALPLWPRGRWENAPSLGTRAFGLEFPNPIGMAAGFDKNAEAINSLLAQGFGFVEAGTVTPRAQAGNPRPRLFRLVEDEAVINRLGFNNEGVEAFLARLQRPRGGIAGANIGKNRDQEDAVADYTALLATLGPHADYITVNISSPNTQGLRDLQSRVAMEALLAALNETRARLSRRVPLLVKLAPDLDEAALVEAAQVALAQGIDGLILTNTTIARPPLKSRHRNETGGLSGRPLFASSTAALATVYRATGGALPLVGAGGVSSGADAYAKIRAGATLVQLYTALVYQGFGLVRRINDELAALLARDGFASVGEAVGVDTE